MGVMQLVEPLSFSGGMGCGGSDGGALVTLPLIAHAEFSLRGTIAGQNSVSITDILYEQNVIDWALTFQLICRKCTLNLLS